MSLVEIGIYGGVPRYDRNTSPWSPPPTLYCFNFDLYTMSRAAVPCLTIPISCSVSDLLPPESHSLAREIQTLNRSPNSGAD